MKTKIETNDEIVRWIPLLSGNVNPACMYINLYVDWLPKISRNSMSTNHIFEWTLEIVSRIFFFDHLHDEKKGTTSKVWFSFPEKKKGIEIEFW